MSLLRQTLVVAWLFCTASVWSADWLSTQKVGDVVHFAIPNPPKIARYDLPNRAWLQAVTLPTSRGPLTAVTIDGSDLYVAYDKAVYRYDASGQNEQHVVTVTTTVQSLFTDGNLLLINHSAGYYAELTSINRTNHAVITSFENYIDSVHGASISRSGNRIFGTTWGISPADVAYVEYRNDGTFVGGDGSPHHGDYEVGTKTWVFPDEGRFADSSGNCYSATGLDHVLSFGTTITDLQFIGSDVPVILSGNKIIGYNNVLLQVGSAPLATTAKNIFIDGDAVLAFSPGAGADIMVETVLLSAISAPVPGQPVNAAELAFTPDTYFLDKVGVLHLLSKAHQNIFRWDPATQTYLDPIPLVGVPEFVTYSPQADLVYVAYASGLVRKLDLSAAEPAEVPHLQLATKPRALSMAGNYLFAMDESGSWNTHFTFAPNGTLISQKDWSYYSKDFVWNEVLQKLYYFRDDTSPNDLLWSEVNASGTAYPSLAPGAIGIVKDSPLHTSTGFVHPIRLAPDGSKVLLGSGLFHDAKSLERLPTALANTFTDAVWLPGQIVSMRAVVSNTTQFQQWLEPTFGQGLVMQIPGTPLRILGLTSSRVLACTLGADGAPSFYVLDGSLAVQAPPVLAAPGSLRVKVASPTSLELNWRDGSGETAYQVERRTLPDGDWQVLGSNTISATTYLDVTVQAGNTYSYRVTARHGQLASDPSAAVDFAFTVPAKPVVLALAEGSSQVRLTWDPVLRAVSYKVFRRTGTSGTWYLQTSTAITETTYLDKYLSPGTTFQYKLEAYNALGASEGSEPATVTTDLVAPAAPSLYTPSASKPREVNVQWSSVSLAASYLIERALVADSVWSTLATVTAPATQYLDTTVLPGTAYQYRMYAINAVGTSPVSTIRQVTTPMPVAPAAPVNLKADNLAGPIIRLGWSDVALEDGYRVERRLGEGSWSLLQTLAKNVISYEDTTVTTGLDYTYRVLAFNDAGATASAELPVYVQTVGLLLADTFDPGINYGHWSELQGAAVRGGAPGFYQGNALWMGASGQRQVALAPMDISLGGAVLKFRFRAGNSAVDGTTYWDNSESSEYVLLEYSKGGGAWTALQTLQTQYPAYSTWTSHSISLPVATLSSATRFRWRQLMHSGSGLDTWALEDVELHGVVPAPPDAPPYFTGNANSSRSVALSWVAAARASSYEIERRTPATNWVSIGTTGVSQTFYTDNTAQPATLYSYRVVAKNAGGSAPPSSYVLISTWSTLAEWRFQNYGTLADTGSASATADNGTGVPNLFKFAFNMAADDHFYEVGSTDGTKGMPTIQFESEAGLLQVAFIRRRAEMNPGIQYEVQFSDNLRDWAAAGQEVVAAPIDENFEYVVWRDAPPPEGASERKTRFGRVKVVE